MALDQFFVNSLSSQGNLIIPNVVLVGWRKEVLKSSAFYIIVPGVDRWISKQCRRARRVFIGQGRFSEART